MDASALPLSVDHDGLDVLRDSLRGNARKISGVFLST